MVARDGRILRLAVALLVCATTPALSSCAADRPAAEVPTLRIALSRENMSAIAYVARDEGTFESNGLDVTLVEQESAQAALEALLAGDVDVALVADTPIVLTALAGTPVRVIATAATDENDLDVVARADAGITTPEDLRGKRIGTRKGTAAHFFLHSFLIKHGMSEGDVQLMFGSFEEVSNALIAGEIDAVSLRQPFTAQLEDALGDEFVLFEEPGLYDKTMNVCVRADVTLSAEAEQRVLRALLEAERIAVANMEQTRREVAAAIGIAEKDLCECLLSEGSVSLRQSLIMTWEDQARWAIASGLATGTAEVDFLEVLDPSALDVVAPERVTIVR